LANAIEARDCSLHMENARPEKPGDISGVGESALFSPDVSE
jgi:hypothetical protein